MTIEHETELYHIDSIFFEEAIACKKGDMNETNTCMYWGCECGDGWFEPLKTFITVVHFINEIATLYNSKFVCTQLKEKYGELTVYYDIRYINPKEKTDEFVINILDNMFDDALTDCEKACWDVCEVCGNNQNLITTKGYIQRLCKTCAERNRLCF